VAVAGDVRLAFVKNHFGLASSNRSYRYVGSFGVDVWNVSTGTCVPVLPFDKYGRLLQLAVSPDASMLALLLVNAATSRLRVTLLFRVFFDHTGWANNNELFLSADNVATVSGI